MDKILLTDSQEAYKSSSIPQKILFRFHLPSVIVASSFLDSASVAQFNDDFFIRFLKNGDRILQKIREVASEVSIESVPIDHVSSNEWTTGLCHALLEEQIEHSLLIQDLVNAFETSHICELMLNNSPLFFTNEKRARKPKNSLQHIKNQLYFWLDIKRAFQQKQQFDFVYLLTTAPHHFELLKKVLSTHLSANERVAVVMYPTPMGNIAKSAVHVPEGVSIFSIQEFRGYPKFKLQKSNWENAKWLDFASVEANYTLMLNMLEHLSPKVCVTMGYQNHTRYLSQACSHVQIPVVSIDYSIITDDYRFERGIRFDHRVTISDAQMKLWKKRNDPSLHHHTIGFLKYDQIADIKTDKKAFEKKVEFAFKKTVLFASSYGFDNQAKYDLIKFLAGYCHKNEYNLLIKKHPLETDMVANEALASDSYLSQKVFRHEEITSLEAISYSDIVVSQGSSIVLDALYFSKPFITYSLGENSITDLMAFEKEMFLLKASTFEELSNAIELAIHRNSKEILKEIQRKRAYYLGDLKGESSICLHKIMTEIKEGK